MIRPSQKTVVELADTAGPGKPHTPLLSMQLDEERSTEEDHDLSVASSYEDPSSNDLNLYQGAALLTADCLGTGLLALPEDVQVLGRLIGIGFLVMNLPINLYAGTILSRSADYVEEMHHHEHIMEDDDDDEQGRVTQNTVDSLKPNKTDYASISAQEEAAQQQHHHAAQRDTSTFDFIGMTHALYPNATLATLLLFYTNIFLVLGDYILVMSHAVVAFVGEGTLCLPEAGVLASTLMFGLCQLRTMAKLGRWASIMSLTALGFVVIQCLWASHFRETSNDAATIPSVVEPPSLLRKFSALGSIGFAVGSQKLFLNIRHELANRSDAPKSLGISLSCFGTFYVMIVLLAGPNPPSFLFDAIAPGWNRRLAGLFLWIHVAVSYAINSQAICSSMDRLFFHSIDHDHPQRRWMMLTALMAVSAYIVSNAIPFFKDLVALIGALTSVPLTLLLPAIYDRQCHNLVWWWPTLGQMSFWLVMFSCVFMAVALVGALRSIELDWSSQGAPFSC